MTPNPYEETAMKTVKELDPTTLRVGQKVVLVYCGRPVGSSIQPMPIETVKTVGRVKVTLSNNVAIRYTDWAEDGSLFGVVTPAVGKCLWNSVDLKAVR